MIKGRTGRVFVAGSINMDVVATAERHPRVGETVAGQQVLYFPGGKGANQAVAAAKLGAPTVLIGRLGNDAFGQELRGFLIEQGVDTNRVRGTVQAQTGTAIVTIANADNTIIVIPGANGLVSKGDVMAAPLAQEDIAVSQFEIPLTSVRAFFQCARAAGSRTILNPAPARAFGTELLELVDILVLNETELGLLANRLINGNGHAVIADAARSLRTGSSQIICVTLGRRGLLALEGDEVVVLPGREVRAVDTTGAGDSFVGALAAGLARGASVRDALGYANMAASISVQRMGAAPSMPTLAEMSMVLRNE